MNKTLLRLRAHAASVVAISRKAVGDFAAKLANDPVAAWTWADGAYTAAARLRHYAELEDRLSRMINGELKINGRDVTELQALAYLRAHYAAIAMRAARHPLRSSSPSNNQIESELAAAAAEIEDLIGCEVISLSGLAA